MSPEVVSNSLSEYFRINASLTYKLAQMEALFVCGWGFRCPIHNSCIYLLLYLDIGWTCKKRSIGKAIILMEWTIYLPVLLSASLMCASKDRAESFAGYSFKPYFCFACISLCEKNIFTKRSATLSVPSVFCCYFILTLHITTLGI